MAGVGAFLNAIGGSVGGPSREPKRAGWASLLAVLLCACGGSRGESAVDAAEGAPRAPDLTLRVDLDGDGTQDVVGVYRSRDERRGFLRYDLAQGPIVSPIYPLWTAAGARLEERGDVVVLGVWSSVDRFGDAEPHRSVWVLGWDGRGFRPRWRGSGLARPLLDFRVIDLDGDGIDELMALEAVGERCYATAYRWTGFGFVGLGRTRLPCDRLAFCPAAAGGEGVVCSPLYAGPLRPALATTGLNLLEEKR